MSIMYVISNRIINNIMDGVIITLLKFYIFMIKKTCRVRIEYASDAAKRAMTTDTKGVFVCWHSRFISLLLVKEFYSFFAVASSHKDADYLSRILEYYGHKVIRGSSRRNAVSAMRALLSIEPEEFRIIITPDGPLGPRFQVKGGCVRIAEKRGVPIVIMTTSATNAMVLKTWDRLILPIPFLSTISIIIDEPRNASEFQNENILGRVMLERVQDLDMKNKLSIEY